MYKKNIDKIKILFKVKKMSADGRIFLRPDFIAKEDADTKSWGASASSLQKYKVWKVYVDPIGRVKDPGFFDKWSLENDSKYSGDSN